MTSSCFGYITLMFVILFNCGDSSQPAYCLPSDSSCWPTQTEITDFSSTISGTLLTQNSSQYPLYVNMTQNLYHRNQYPSFIILCKTVQDIEKSVSFSSSHNIQISIMSTGHSYSGRSTANFSLQINLSQMRNYKINNNSITVESGLQWGSIYGIVSYYNKTVIGTWDPSVGPIGSAMGGGHSPFNTAFGFIADHIVEAYLVDSNAHIIHIYNTSGDNETIDELFWSIRGGGGGTFGVTVNITFELIDVIQSEVVTQIGCIYTSYQYPAQQKHFILDVILNNYFNLIQSDALDRKWGGLVLGISGSGISVFEATFLYYGDPIFAKQNGQPLMSLSYPYNNSVNTQCSLTVYQTIGEYLATMQPDTGGRFERMSNVMVPSSNLTQELTDVLIGYLNASVNETKLNGATGGVSFFPTGGVSQDKGDDFNALHPAFRHTFMELNTWTNWFDSNVSNRAVEYMNRWETKLRPFGYPAIYSNEEEYDCDCDWKQLYWGNQHYQTLLKVKKTWDPNQVFWCNHCVGDGDY